MKMRWMLTAALLLVAVGPAQTLAAAGQAEAGTLDPQFVEAVLGDAAAGRHAEALARIDEAVQRRPAPARMRELETLRGMVLLLAARLPEAQAAFARAEAVAPNDPTVALQHLAFAFELRAVDAILPALDHLIDRFPEQVRTIEPLRITPLIGWLRRNERAAEADALMIRLALNGFGGNDLTARDNYAIEAAAAALTAGRREEAARLAARVNSRTELTIALTERRFEPLWPALEARIGPHMSVAEAAWVREAEAIAAAAPEDPLALRSLLQAYRDAGRLADAERVGARFAASPAAMAAIDQAGAWLVNDHAFVLHALGRGAEADARLAAMRVIDIDRAPWLISMVINRLSLLTDRERWDEALALQHEAGRLAESHGSPYARQLVRSYKTCAFQGLGRTAERDAGLAELRSHETDSPGATIDGLICAGRLDEAERVLVRWLERPGAAGGPVDSLQPARSKRATATPVARGWQQLLERPAVRRAFDPVGRVLPEAFWPRPPEAR